MGHKGFAFVTILFLILAWRSWNKECYAYEEITNQTSVTHSEAPTITHTVASTASNSSASQYSNIDQTLKIVSEKWKTTDVNKDGLYNCIDAAVLFYKHYPDKNKVAIILNKNPNSGMNHLLNAVYINDVWRAIEPQSYATGHKSYWMKDVWGNQYDNSYNEVATANYLRYTW